METILNITNYPTALKGLEKIKNIEILANYEIIISYTIKEKYMKYNNLTHKNRILRINPNGKEEWQKVQDYAIPEKGVI